MLIWPGLKSDRLLHALVWVMRLDQPSRSWTAPAAVSVDPPDPAGSAMLGAGDPRDLGAHRA